MVIFRAGAGMDAMFVDFLLKILPMDSNGWKITEILF